MRPQAVKGGGVFIGGPTVLTVLLTLCLCCFALLTWYKAKVDYDYTTRAAQTVNEFYETDLRAEELLAQLAPIADSMIPGMAGPAMVQLLAQQDISGVWDGGASNLTFSIPAGVQGDLRLILHLREQPRSSVCTITYCQILPHDYEEEDAPLPVYQILE